MPQHLPCCLLGRNHSGVKLRVQALKDIPVDSYADPFAASEGLLQRQLNPFQKLGCRLGPKLRAQHPGKLGVARAFSMAVLAVAPSSTSNNESWGSAAAVATSSRCRCRCTRSVSS